MTMAGRPHAVRVRSDRARLWEGGRPRLVRLDVELTERCTNDCVHCSINLPAGDTDARGREMSAGMVKRILAEAAGLGCLTVRFTGGEPLLREDFEEIYLAARTLGLKVLLFTNAALISPRLADLMKRIPPLEPIEASVYGMSERSSAAVTRNPEAFEAARRGLALLVERGLPFVVKGALLPATLGETEEFESFARRLAGPGGFASYVLLLDLRSRRDGAKNDLIRRLRMSPGEFLRVASRGGPDVLEEWRSLAVAFSGACGDRLFDCLESGGTGSVDAYGVFQPCLGLRHPRTAYDLAEGSLREAVTVFLPRVRALRAADPVYVERCGRCRLRGLCHQCPAKSWAEHGTLDTPVDYFCGIAHAQAEAIGLLAAGEKSWEAQDWPARLERLAGSSARSGKEIRRTAGKGCEGGTTCRS